MKKLLFFLGITGLIVLVILTLSLTLTPTGRRLTNKKAVDAPARPTAQPHPIPAQTKASLQYLPLISNTAVEPLGELSSDWYLMVDDWDLQSREVPRLYHPFEKVPGNPIVQVDRPWEGRVIQLFGTVLPGFRMWYSSYRFNGGNTEVLYAESQDGLRWIKPGLNGKDPNVLFSGEDANLVSVLSTPSDLGRPYKLMVYQNHAFHGYWSEDGLATNSYPENPVYTSGSDVAHFYWDVNTDRYRGTSKGSEFISGTPRRVVRFIDSPDFIHWQQAAEILAPDFQDDTLDPRLYTGFYGMPVFPLGRQYLGLLWVIKAPDKDGLTGKVNVQLASSHDGTHWTREDGNRPPILDVGSPGEWDAGQVYTAVKPVRVGDMLWLYYSGCNQEHGSLSERLTCNIGLATAPLNRLASLSGTGRVLTRSLKPDGSRLHVNYDGSQGMLRVELLQDGRVVPGYEAVNCLPLTSNAQDQVVTWADKETLPEEDFQIRFVLENSSVYAFAMQ